MIKKIYLLSGLIIAGILAVSCITDEPEPESTLNFARSDIDVPARAKEVVSVDVTSNTRWRVDVEVLDTLKVLNYGIVSPGSSEERKFGVGSGTLNLTLAENGPDENGEFSEREFDVVIYVDDIYVDAITDKLTVKQEAGEYWIELSDPDDDTALLTEIEIARGGGNYRLRVASNGPWTSSYSEEITSSITGEEDKHGTIIIINVPGNTTGAPRSFSKVFRVERSPYPEVELLINQAG